METGEKEVPRSIGDRGLPDLSGQIQKSPKIGGFRGLIRTFSSLSDGTVKVI